MLVAVVTVASNATVLGRAFAGVGLAARLMPPPSSPGRGSASPLPSAAAAWPQSVGAPEDSGTSPPHALVGSAASDRAVATTAAAGIWAAATIAATSATAARTSAVDSERYGSWMARRGGGLRVRPPRAAPASVEWVLNVLVGLVRRLGLSAASGERGESSSRCCGKRVLGEPAVTDLRPLTTMLLRGLL